MKHLKFFATLFVAACLLFLSSCNSAGDTKAVTPPPDSTVASKKDSLPAPVPTPGPKMLMLISHKVANYAKWKMGYDAHDSVRQSYGLHNYMISRGLMDSNIILIALKMDDLAKAKTMAASPGMKDRMKKGGVVGPTAIDYLETIDYDTAGMLTSPRLSMRHKVKDFDAWKKVYDSDKQARMDAGLTDRVLGFLNGDHNNVTLVFSVADVEKAKAFGNSKELQEKMMKAGVIGKPSTFFYKVAERY